MQVVKQQPSGARNTSLLFDQGLAHFLERAVERSLFFHTPITASRIELHLPGMLPSFQNHGLQSKNSR